MRFAISIPAAADSWRVVRRAEELGFSRAWFYDTQMLSADPFVAMAAAAMRTTQIRTRHRCFDPVEQDRAGSRQCFCIAQQAGARADRFWGGHRLHR